MDEFVHDLSMVCKIKKIMNLKLGNIIFISIYYFCFVCHAEEKK